MLNLILKKKYIFLLAHFLPKFDIKSIFYLKSRMCLLFFLSAHFKSIRYLNLWKLQTVLILYIALLLIHYNDSFHYNDK